MNAPGYTIVWYMVLKPIAFGFMHNRSHFVVHFYVCISNRNVYKRPNIILAQTHCFQCGNSIVFWICFPFLISQFFPPFKFSFSLTDIHIHVNFISIFYRNQTHVFQIRIELYPAKWSDWSNRSIRRNDKPSIFMDIFSNIQNKCVF